MEEPNLEEPLLMTEVVAEDEDDIDLRTEKLEELRYSERRNVKSIWCGIIALSLGICGAIAVICLFREVETMIIVPKDRPVFPMEYEASISLHLPYIDLIEPIYVHVNEHKRLQRLSYYGGMDTLVINETGASYQVVPVLHNFSCFRIGDSPQMLPIFPNVSDFDPQTGTSYIQGQSCLSWQKVVSGEVPDSEGMIGTYTLYVDEVTNDPVRYHYVGHNVMLGGSHVDEYFIDYEFIRPGPVADVMFAYLPSSMQCPVMPDDTQKFKIIPHAEDLQMLFPEGNHIKRRQFQDFQEQYHKQHTDLTSNHERIHRWTNFHHNLRFVNSMNRKGLSYTLKMNHFGDLSPEEHLEHHRNRMKRPANNQAPFQHQMSAAGLPSHKDWRESGAVRKVKDQGLCGSCWSFGTTGALEGAMFVKYRKKIELSQQNLMDCSWEEGNHACDGGLDFQAYQWIINSGGIQSAASYGPYLNVDGFCHFDPTLSVLSLTGFTNVTGVEALNDALANVGPVSVSIDATPRSFYFYHQGVYDDPTCRSGIENLDHSVLAVGYYTDAQTKERVTIVKNSWSNHWGIDGYIMIAQTNNICGVATAATYPNLN